MNEIFTTEFIGDMIVYYPIIFVLFVLFILVSAAFAFVLIVTFFIQTNYINPTAGNPNLAYCKIVNEDEYILCKCPFCEERIDKFSNNISDFLYSIVQCHNCKNFYNSLEIINDT